MEDIVLTPLGQDDLRQLLVDSLHCEPGRAAPLAKLIHEKTTGNPFFAIQFISTLAEEGLLSFDYGEGRWVWDLNRIHAKGYTDNVVELMVGKLNRLPVDTQEALKQFACMGNSAEFDMLANGLREVGRGTSPTPLGSSTDRTYLPLGRFLSLPARSRAGSSLFHDSARAACRGASAHRHASRCAHPCGETRGGDIRDRQSTQPRLSPHHLCRGPRAGRRPESDRGPARENLDRIRLGAQVSQGRPSALLTEETWERNYPLIFSIDYLMAECELLTAEKVAAENRLSLLAQRANNRHDFCVATRLRLTLYTTLDRSDLAADVFLDWLRRDGTVWSNHPTREDVMREYERIWELLGRRTIEELIDLPLITDPDVLDTLDVFTEIMTPSQLFDEHLNSLVICRLVTLSLEHGNCDASCFAYVWLAMFAGPRFNNYKDGFRFGQLGYDLVEKRGLTRYQARIWMNMGSTVLPWAKHVASGRELVRRAFDAAYRIGDLTFASYSWVQLVTVCLAAGDPLAAVQTECENGLAFAKSVRFGFVIELCGAQLGLILTLRGLTPAFGRLDHEDYGELDTERRLADSPNLAFAEFYYWTRKLQAHFFAGDLASAVDASLRAEPLLWTSAAMFESAEYRLYGALVHAAAWDHATPEQRPRHFDSVLDHHRQLEVWAEVNPETFEDRAALVGAEIARIEGRVLDAQELYEKAIRSAHKHGFVHNEAIANELAGCFYAARGFEKIATTYLRDARYCYLRWGADGKVRQLEQLYPQLRVDKPIADSTATILTPVEHLDLATVIKVSEAVSGEIVFEKLIDTLMRSAIEHAGAERGLLILPRGDGHRIEAEATTSTDNVNVVLRKAGVTAADLPNSVFHYVVRTKEAVLLHDASGQNPFSADQYIRDHCPQSVLCLPLLKQTQITWCALPGKHSHARRLYPCPNGCPQACLLRRRRSPWRTRVSIVTSKSAKPAFGGWLIPTS